MFSDKYILENKDGEKLVQLESKFSWRAFHYKYDISYGLDQNKRLADTLLLLFAVYSANFFIATMSGANAGMMA